MATVIWEKVALVENAVGKLERQIKNNVSSCFSNLILDVNTNLNTNVQSIFRNVEKLEHLVREEALQLKNDILVLNFLVDGFLVTKSKKVPLLF